MNESTIRITQQLGTLLRSYRKYKKIPQKEFAQRVGLCQSRVKTIIRQRRSGDYASNFAGVSLNYLDLRPDLKESPFRRTGIHLFAHCAKSGHKNAQNASF